MSESNGRKKDKKVNQTGLAAAGFISFSDVMGTHSSTTATSSHITNASSSTNFIDKNIGSTGIPIYPGTHAELGMCCKKALKKDMVTKVKAIQEITQIISSESTSEGNLIPDFLSFFTYLFGKVALENEWTVRERLGQLLSVLVSKDKQALTPHMKDIIGPWFQLICDPVPEVSERFRNAFTAAIPTKKRRPVVLHLIHALMAHAMKFLSISDQELRELSVGNSAEELEEKKDRLLQSNITAFKEIISILAVSNSDENSPSYEIFKNTFRSLIADKTLLKHGSSKMWAVRKAVFEVLIAAAAYQPTLLSDNVSMVAKCLVDGLDNAVDSSMGLDQALQAWIDLPKALGLNSFWVSLPIGNIVKRVFSLRSSNIEALIDHLLPFVANLPLFCAGVYDLQDTVSSQQMSQGNKVFHVLIGQMADWLKVCKTASSYRKISSLVALLEVGIYLLLRKSSAELPRDSLSPNMERVRELILLLKDLLDSALEVSLNPLKEGEVVVRGQIERSKEAEAKLRSTIITALSLVSRATSQGQFLGRNEWVDLFWSPLFDGFGEEVTPSPSLHMVRNLLSLLHEADNAADSLEQTDSVVKSVLSQKFIHVLQGHLTILLGSTTLESSTVKDDLAGAFHLLHHAITLTPPVQSISTNLHLLIESVMNNHTQWLSKLLNYLIGDSSEWINTWRDMLIVLVKLKKSCDRYLEFLQIIVSSSLAMRSVVPLKEILKNAFICEDVVWSSDDIQILRDLGETFLKQKLNSIKKQSKEYDSLEYLVSIHLASSLEELSQELLLKVKELWLHDNTITMAVWYQLSMIMLVMRDKDIQRNSMTREMIVSLLEDGGICLVDRLLSLFLIQTSHDDSEPKGLEEGKETLNNQVDAVHSWSSIEDYLLPFLPIEINRSFEQAILDHLNRPFVSSTIGKEGVIKPNNWGRQALHYLQMTQKGIFVSKDSVDQQEFICLVLLTPEFWERSMSERQFNSLSQGVLCFHALLTSSWKISRHIKVHILSHKHDLWLGLLKAVHFLKNREIDDLQYEEQIVVKYAKEIENQLLQEFSALVPRSRMGAVKFLIEHALVPQNDNLVCLAVLSSVLATLASARDEPASTIQLSSPLPHPAQAKGMSISYLSQQTVEIDGSLLQHYSLKPASIVSTHLENGLYRPYYTVKLLEDDKEVQTEWYRLFLSIPSSLQSVVDTMEVITESSRKPALISNLGEESMRTLLLQYAGSIVNELQDLCVALSSSKAIAFVRTISWKEYNSKVDLFSSLFPVLMELLLIDQQGTDNVEMVEWEAFVFILRGVVSIRGGGLWLNQIVASLWQLLLVDDQSRTAKHGRDVVTGLCLSVDAILQVYDWDSIVEIAARYLFPLMLTTFQKEGKLIDSSFITASVSVLAQWWIRYRQSASSSARKTPIYDESDSSKRPPLEWEGLAVEYLLRLFHQLTTTTPVASELSCQDIKNERVMVNVIAALHSCFLDRSRAEASSLFNRALAAGAVPLNHLYEQVFASYDFSLRYLLSVYGANVHSIRLAAAKLLDIHHSQPTLPVVVNDENESDSKVLETCEKDIEADEEADIEEDRRLFEGIVGLELNRELHHRYDAFHVLQQQSSAQLDYNSDDSLEDKNNTSDDEVEERVPSVSGSGKFTNPIPLQQPEKLNRVQQNEFWRRWSRQDAIGSIFVWLLLLQTIDAAREGNGQDSNQSSQIRIRCANFLKHSGLFVNAQQCLVHIGGDLLKTNEISGLFQRTAFLHHSHHNNKSNTSYFHLPSRSLQQLAIYAIYRSICVLPSLFRYYWNEYCPRQLKQKLSKFIEEKVRASIIRREVYLIQVSKEQKRWDEETFQVQGNIQTGEIQAEFLHDETKIGVTIRIPANYPLKNVDVQCSTRIGVSDGRWRRWVLQMIQVLSLQDQSVVEAALVWKNNIEQELHGVEPCPICYCTLHNKTLKLPSFKCPTCSHKFHPSCLFTWFKSSGKSNCVLCQQPLFR
eukprot:scaffold1534_cov158-Ochromonas_danica.AAC.9